MTDYLSVNPATGQAHLTSAGGRVLAELRGVSLPNAAKRLWDSTRRTFVDTAPWRTDRDGCRVRAVESKETR